MATYMPNPDHDGPIPGEHDASTLTHRQPGAIGGRPTGDDTPSPKPEDVMDSATIHDRELEGGGQGSHTSEGRKQKFEKD